MKKFLPVATALLSAFTLNAQTNLFTEDFNGNTNQFTLNTSDLSSAYVSNSWLVNNSYTGGTGTFMCMSFPFTFTVPNTAAQPAGISGSPASKYMHITSQASVSSGITCACFLAADGICTFDEYNFTKMTSDISTVGYSNTTLSFWWLCGGGPFSYGELYYSIDGGITWTAVSGQYLNNGSQWQQQFVYDSTFDNQATLRFGFRFTNQQTSSASDPGFCIDDVMIDGQLAMGVSSTANFTEMTAFPNPANDVLTLKNNMAGNNITITITDIAGAIIRRETRSNSNLIEINTAELSAGCYFLTAEAGESKSTVRFSVTH